MIKLSELEANGMITLEPSDQLMNEMCAQAQPIWQAFVARVPEAAPLLAAFLSATGKTASI